MQPTLHTPRLILRPFRMEDAAALRELADDQRIADTTSALPHPYLEGMAEQWIATHRGAFEAGSNIIFAITRRESTELLGAIELRIQEEGHRGEFGYWVGAAHWNQGYCTEALRALIDYGFESWNLHRIYAVHFTRNAASGRVMTKAGMRHEGHLREHLHARGCMEDVEVYGIMRREWEAGKRVDPGI